MTKKWPLGFCSNQERALLMKRVEQPRKKRNKSRPMQVDLAIFGTPLDVDYTYGGIRA